MQKSTSWIILFHVVIFIIASTIAIMSVACQNQSGDIAVTIQPEDKMQSNLHDVKVMLERYAAKHFKYPEDIATLKREGYLPADTDPSYPQNPFTNQPVKFIEFKTKPFAGEITYVPVKSNSKVTGYYLLGYGDRRTRGHDVDGDGKPDYVIIIMQGPDYELIQKGLGDDLAEKMRRFLADENMSPLKDVLKSQ